MEDFTFGEYEILAVIAANIIDTGEFSPGVPVHPTLMSRVKSAHSKLIESIESYR